MNAFFKFSKELANRDFISFMEEKQIHPSDLISLAIKIKNKSLFNEYSNLSSSGFLSGIGGALRGMYHGFRAGLGTRSLNSATITLKKQLQLAYEKFLDSLIGITGNEVAAVRIVTMLRKNAEQDIDHRVFGMAPIVPKPETTAPTSGKKKPIEVEEPEEEKPEKESSEEETKEEDDEGEDGEGEEDDEGEDGEGEEDGEDEDDDAEFINVTAPATEEEETKEEDSLTPEEIEEDPLEQQFDVMLKSSNTSEIHEKINNEFPIRGRNNTKSLDALIACLNKNETSEPYITEGFGIINQLHSDFISAKETLAKRFSAYVKQNLSENLRRILFREGEGSGREIPMNLEQKKHLIKSKTVKKYIIDKDKINDIDDFVSILHNVESYLESKGERNVRPLRGISSISKINNIDNRNLLIKMMIDEMGNYVYLTEEDIRKIEVM
jgi:hypothetical protein